MSTATCPVHHQQQGGGRGGRRPTIPPSLVVHQPVISFERMVKRVARRHGTEAAVRWTRAVLGHQASINEAALRSAIASKNLKAIEAAVRSSALQQVTQKAVQGPLHSAVVAGGQGGAETLAAEGLAVTFNAAHPNVALQAQLIAAQLVVGIPKDTKRVIAEVVALGSQQGLTTAQQARAIREVVGLPPNWAQAPLRLADEIRTGRVAAATGRRLSATAKQQIRSRVARGTVTSSFVQRMQSEYTRSLINRRSLNIARTESLRAAHAGLHESWVQGMQQGAIPQTARRFWLVTPDSRLSPEHARIPRMNPNGRGIREPFFTPDGSFLYPPSRPNCRCSVGLSVARPGEVREPIAAEGGVIMGEDIVPVGPTAAPPSEVLGGSMQRVSQNIAENPHEWGVIWDAGGRIVTNTTSRSRHAVAIPRSAWRRAKNGSFTHNHPSGGSFSFADIENVVKYDIKETWAVSAGDSFRVVRPEGGWPTWMSVEAKYKRVEQSMRTARQAAGVRTGSAQWVELERRFTHDVWQNVFRDIGARYERFALAEARAAAPRVAPPRARRVSTSNPELAEESIRALPAMAEYETAVIWDSSGNHILTRRGAHNRVSFANSDMRKMNGGTLTHNHPFESSFSQADIEFARSASLIEMRAFTRDYTYIMRRTRGTMPWRASIGAEYKKLYWELDRKYLRTELTPSEITARVTHEVMEELSRRHGFTYERIGR